MATILVNTQGMNKTEWKKWRNKGIGGSDVSTLCGINKYKSVIELWMEKTVSNLVHFEQPVRRN